MSTLYGTRKYAIEGDNAAKVYDAVVNSFMYRNFPDTLTLEYKEGLLMIVEEWTNYPRFGDYVLPFLIGEDFYWLDYWAEDDTWSTNDDAGKYFSLS